MVKILEVLVELKHEYIKKFGVISYERGDYETCVHRWAGELNISLYKDIIINLNIKQKDSYVICKYLSFEVLFTRNKELNFKDFWSIYDGVYKDCRGITIDLEDECLVTLPYEKFFNINAVPENEESKISKEILKAKCVEFSDKLDGSLLVTRYYKNEYFVSTSSMFDESESPIIAWSNDYIMKHKNYQNIMKEYSDYTLLFECICDYTSLTVVYPSYKHGLYLTNMRNMKTGELKSYSEIIQIANKYGIKSTEECKMSFSEVLASLDKYKASEKEGYVMYIDGRLVKIKCDDYLLLHNIAGNHCSKSTIIRAIYKDELDELKSFVPVEFLPIIDETVHTISEYFSLMDKEVEKYLIKAPKELKEFFAWVNTVPKFINRYVISKYLNKPLSYLVKGVYGKEVSFVKWKEIEDIMEKIKKESV